MGSILLLYIIEIVILTIVEKKNWGTYLTPLNCLSIPTGVITLLAIVYPYFSNFPHFYLPSLIVWIIGLGIFELPSMVLSQALKSKTYKNNLHITFCHRHFYIAIVIFSIIAILITFLKMKSAAATATWGSDEFSDNYSSNSFIGHLSVVIAALLSYTILISGKDHKAAIIISILFIISLYAVGVKSWIIAPIMIGFLARVKLKLTKFSYKIILILLFTFSGVFILSYILLMVVAGKSEFNSDFINFLLNHFMFYLIGSPLSFSIDFQAGILEPTQWEALFAPLVNICRLFTSEPYIDPINPTLIPIAEGHANVRTFIGTIFAYSNSWMGMTIVLLIFSITINFIYLISYHTHNPFLILANCANLTFLNLGFFEFYWLNLRPYEIIGILLFMSFIYRYFPVAKCKKVISV